MAHHCMIREVTYYIYIPFGKGFDPPKSQIEKIGDKISNAEIERYSFFYKNEPSKYQWSDFQFGDKHKMNITKYIDQKFGK